MGLTARAMCLGCRYEYGRGCSRRGLRRWEKSWGTSARCCSLVSNVHSEKKSEIHLFSSSIVFQDCVCKECICGCHDSYAMGLTFQLVSVLFDEYRFSSICLVCTLAMADPVALQGS